MVIAFTPITSIGASFDLVMPLLGEQRQVVAIDSLGYGMSDRPERDLEPEEYAQSMLAVMNALGAERFAVCGVHTGAHLGAALVQGHPDRVSAFVLSGPVLMPPERRGEQLQKAAPPPPPRPDGSHLAESWQHRWRIVEPVRDPAVFQRRWLQGIIAGPSAQVAYHAVYKYDLLEQLQSIECPMLLINGDRDLTYASTVAVRPLLPAGLEEAVIPGGTLDTHDEFPEHWSALILDFLSRTAGALP